jgi:hypothetical protein
MEKLVSKKLALDVMLEEKKVVVDWILGMQACGLSIALQQFKFKVTKFTQTKPTLFQNNVIKYF